MMPSRHWPTIRTCLAAVAVLSAPRVAAQSSDTTSFVTTQGNDTVAIEQYTRTGNAISGAWIQHQGGVAPHPYALVLGADGWPVHYVISLYLPRPHTFLMSVTQGSDSATRILVRDSTAATQRVAAYKAYPVLGSSMVGIELGLARARLAHADSSSIVLDRAEQRLPPQVIPVKFFAGDSVRIGDAMRARVDPNGRLLGLRVGPQETRRVPSLDAAKVMGGFVAADAAARAARVEIVLSPAALQRFVGEYSVNPQASVVVTLEGNKLMMRVGKQPAVRLLAASPTTFFLEATTAATFEFDTDAAGNVTSLTLVQSGARQRAAKTK